MAISENKSQNIRNSFLIHKYEIHISNGTTTNTGTIGTTGTRSSYCWYYSCTTGTAGTIGTASTSGSSGGTVCNNNITITNSQ